MSDETVAGECWDDRRVARPVADGGGGVRAHPHPSEDPASVRGHTKCFYTYWYDCPEWDTTPCADMTCEYREATDDFPAGRYCPETFQYDLNALEYPEAEKPPTAPDWQGYNGKTWNIPYWCYWRTHCAQQSNSCDLIIIDATPPTDPPIKRWVCRPAGVSASHLNDRMLVSQASGSTCTEGS